MGTEPAFLQGFAVAKFKAIDLKLRSLNPKTREISGILCFGTPRAFMKDMATRPNCVYDRSIHVSRPSGKQATSLLSRKVETGGI